MYLLQNVEISQCTHTHIHIINGQTGASGWLSWLSIWHQLRLWSHGSWVWAPHWALGWRLGAQAYFRFSLSFCPSPAWTQHSQCEDPREEAPSQKTVRSWPEPKSRVGRLPTEPPRRPFNAKLLNEVFTYQVQQFIENNTAWSREAMKGWDHLSKL